MKARSELNRQLDRLERQLKAIRREVKTQPAPSLLSVSEELYNDLGTSIELNADWLKGFREEAA